MLNAKTPSITSNLFNILPGLFSILITFIIITVVAVSYRKKLQDKHQTYEPKGIVLVLEIYVMAIENIVIEILGRKYRKPITIYCLFLFTYIMVGNCLEILGFNNPISSYTIIFSMGLVAFFGIYYFGFKYQKLAFFKRYYINPLELFSQFVPLISMTFRLWGNTVGGTIIISLLYQFTGYLWSHVPLLGPFNFLGMLVCPWVTIYFNLFDNVIQGYIFTILTLIYWQVAMVKESENKETTKTYNRKTYILNKEKELSKNKKLLQV